MVFFIREKIPMNGKYTSSILVLIYKIPSTKWPRLTLLGLIDRTKTQICFFDDRIVACAFMARGKPLESEKNKAIKQQQQNVPTIQVFLLRNQKKERRFILFFLFYLDLLAALKFEK